MPWPDWGGQSPANLYGVLFRLHLPSLLKVKRKGGLALFLRQRLGGTGFLLIWKANPVRWAQSYSNDSPVHPLGQQRHLLAGAVRLQALGVPTRPRSRFPRAALFAAQRVSPGPSLVTEGRPDPSGPPALRQEQDPAGFGARMAGRPAELEMRPLGPWTELRGHSSGQMRDLITVAAANTLSRIYSLSLQRSHHFPHNTS